jgi:hypothetical protein
MLGFASLANSEGFEIELFAIAAVPPTTNIAETQRITITQYLADLPKREVYLRVEREMVKDRPHSVSAGLTLGSAQELIKDLSGAGDIQIIDSAGPVAPEMSATLSGEGFQFPSGSPPRQFVDSARPTTWKWQVVPTKTGKLKLLLRVAVIVTLPGVNVEKEYQVKEQEVTVIVGLWGWAQWIGEIFLAGIKWLLVGLGAFMLPSLWKRLKSCWKGFRRFVKFRKQKRTKRRQTGP